MIIDPTYRLLFIRVFEPQNKFGVLAARLDTYKNPWCLVYSQSLKEIADEVFDKLRFYYTDLKLNELEIIISKALNSLPIINLSAITHFWNGLEIQLSDKCEIGEDDCILILAYHFSKGRTIYLFPNEKLYDDDYQKVEDEIGIIFEEWDEFKNLFNSMVS